MEKKYCLHCHTILDSECRCKVCGKKEFQRIIIQVQHQSGHRKEE